MATAFKYVFGPFGFNSQKAVMQHARLVRDRYVENQTIDAPEDMAFLDGLLSRHVERDTKIGVGVAGYFWAIAPEHDSACFYLTRRDGTSTEFGVKACFATVRQLNLQSLRMAVRTQIEAYRRSRVDPGADWFTSDFSREVFPVGELEVDHVPPFEQLVQTFCADRRIALDTEMLTISADLRSEPTWRDDSERVSFCSFHALTATLRLVAKIENLSSIARANNAARRASSTNQG